MWEKPGGALHPYGAWSESEVYKIFQEYYTVAQLDARTLWQRIDAELAARGGCGAIPPE